MENPFLSRKRQKTGEANCVVLASFPVAALEAKTGVKAKTKAKKRFLQALFVFAAFLLSPAQVAAEDVLSSFLMPLTIFVGDQARLLVTLGGDFSHAAPFVRTHPPHLQENAFFVITRIELERRGGTTRLLIDFIPFATGTLYFPPIEFASLNEDGLPLKLSGLYANVASVLAGESMELSMPAAPLAVPGTGLLIYGSITAVILIVFLSIAVSVWGRRNFEGFWLQFRRGYLLRAMMRFLRRLRHEGNLKKNGNPGIYLGLLAAEFREFLSAFTGINCRPLSPLEFNELLFTRGVSFSAGTDRRLPAPLSSDFLCNLFRSWDALRFSGKDVEKSDFFQAVDETEKFVCALREMERENNRVKGTSALPVLPGTTQNSGGGNL